MDEEARKESEFYFDYFSFSCRFLHKKDVDLTSFCLLLGFYMNHAFGLVGITTLFYCMRSCLVDYNVEDPL